MRQGSKRYEAPVGRMLPVEPSQSRYFKLPVHKRYFFTVPFFTVIYQVMCLSHDIDNSDVDGPVLDNGRRMYIGCNCVTCKPSKWLNTQIAPE